MRLNKKGFLLLECLISLFLLTQIVFLISIVNLSYQEVMKQEQKINYE